MSTAPASSVQTLVDELPNRLSSPRKWTLLLMCCLAQSLDAFNNAALFPAIPTLEDSMGIKQGESAWIISAFQLTFASFLLIGGRISDIYNPKNAFIAGMAFLGIFSIGAGFVHNKIVLIVLRALMGIASALSIPSALTLLVHIFPEPTEQARAIAAFGGCGAVADALGWFLAAVLVQKASYHWIFWFSAIVAIPVSLGCIFIIPAEVAKSEYTSKTGSAKWKSLDLIGVSILTVALILFIYGVTSGSANGWATAGVLVPLIISTILIVAFFYWETIIPVDNASIPPRMWFYNNFSVLFGLALLPFFWWNAVFLVFTTLWQDVFHWTVISIAVHMFPVGVANFAMSFTGSLSSIFSPKWVIFVGLSMMAVATVLLATCGGRPEDYWPYVFPALTIGSAGTMLTYTHANIAILQASPTSMSGTVGAVFNGALQFGSAIGLAAFSSIETSLEAIRGGPKRYHGRAAALWFLLGIVWIEILSLAYFYRRETNRESDSTSSAHSHDSNITAGVADSEEKSRQLPTMRANEA